MLRPLIFVLTTSRPSPFLGVIVYVRHLEGARLREKHGAKLTELDLHNIDGGSMSVPDKSLFPARNV